MTASPAALIRSVCLPILGAARRIFCCCHMAQFQQ
jgi:hypothetical protein